MHWADINLMYLIDEHNYIVIFLHLWCFNDSITGLDMTMPGSGAAGCGKPHFLPSTIKW